MARRDPPAGRLDTNHLASALGYLPTICDYAGVPAPPNVRGRSLRGVIETPSAPGAEAVVCEVARGPAGPSAERAFMVRTAAHKYLRIPDGDGVLEALYDMAADPHETRNLVGDPILVGELERHRRLLADWRRQTEEDRHPVNAARPPARVRRC